MRFGVYGVNIWRALRRAAIVTTVIGFLSAYGTVPYDEPIGLRSLLIGFQLFFEEILIVGACAAGLFILIELFLWVKNSGANLSGLTGWYSELTNKQRWIVLVGCLVLSAIPIVGWLGLAWWLIPLVVYLEFRRPSEASGK
jgi:hypothetical protein